MTTIYKICTAAEWRDAERDGAYRGSAVDRQDGFIHFSTAEQAAETAAKWFAGQRDLVLVAVDAEALGDKLKWEPSRGGALFPHLYGDLPLPAVHRVDPLPLDETGRHVFPRFSCCIWPSAGSGRADEPGRGVSPVTPRAGDHTGTPVIINRPVTIHPANTAQGISVTDERRHGRRRLPRAPPGGFELPVGASARSSSAATSRSRSAS